MSIIEVREWIEVNKKIVTLGALFFLVSSISFALGYLSAGELKHPQIVIEQNIPTQQMVGTPTLPLKVNVGEASIISQVKPVKEPKKDPVAPKPVPAPVPVYVPVQESTPVAVTPPPPVEQTPPSVSEPVATPAATPVQPETAPPPPAPVPLSPIQITEVTAGTEVSSDDEFIELYNPNSVAVDLTDYSIKKKTSSGSESSLVSASRLVGKSIPAGKHFLIAHDEGYVGSVTPDATWAKSNSLAYTNNTVILYNASDVKVAEVSWTELQKGQSTSGVPSPQNSSQ